MLPNHAQFLQHKLRIAIIIEDLRLPFDEGAKKTGINLIRSLKNNNARICVFTQYENPLLEDAFHLPRNKFLFGCLFGQQLRKQASDVILYIPTSSGTIGAFVRSAFIKAQSHNIPTVMLNLQYRNLPQITKLMRPHRIVDIVFTQSPNSAQVFRSLGCKTILLSGGVDSTIFQPVSKKEKQVLRLKYGFTEEERIILHVGHCNRNRNLAFLTRLVKVGFRVIMIASTSSLIDHDLLVELRQSGVTVIINYIENIQQYYQLSDCYVFPVFYATSAIDTPLSVLEALACNLPVVTTKFGALPNMFQAGNGLYYAETEPEILCMVRKAVEERNCHTLEKVSQFTWDNITLTILEALKETTNL